jgi:hypothetical protein
MMPVAGSIAIKFLATQAWQTVSICRMIYLHFFVDVADCKL